MNQNSEQTERLAFIEKLQKRIQESKEGNLISEEELKASVESWFNC